MSYSKNFDRLTVEELQRAFKRYRAELGLEFVPRKKRDLVKNLRKLVSKCGRLKGSETRREILKKIRAKYEKNQKIRSNIEKKKKEELKRRLAKRLTKALTGSGYHSKKKKGGVLKGGITVGTEQHPGVVVNVIIAGQPGTGEQFYINAQTTPQMLINQHFYQDDISCRVLVNGAIIYNGNGVNFQSALENIPNFDNLNIGEDDNVYIIAPNTGAA